MKKRIFLLISFIMLIILAYFYFSTLNTTGYSIFSNTKCSDSDNGKNIYEKGIVTYGKKEYSDYCKDNMVVEYYCIDKNNIFLKKFGNENTSCENGCQEGKCVINSFKNVIDLKVNNSGLGKSIFLSWNQSNESYSGYAVARFKVTNGELSQPDLVPSNPQSHFAVDYNVEEGATYEYKVFSYEGGSFNLEKLENIMAYRIQAKMYDSNLERILFIVPDEYNDGSNNIYFISQSLIEGINEIFRNTKKQFIFSGIKFYSSGEDVLNNAEYVESGAISTYFIPSMMTTGYTQGANPPITVIGGESESFRNLIFNINPEENNTYYLQLLYVLAHEITHTYGAGYPEYYMYSMGNAIDTSNIEPLILNISLPERYRNDVLYNHMQKPSEYIFSPLSIKVIEDNLDHSNSKYLNYEFDNLHPNQILVNISDSASKPSIDANVHIYCMDLVDIRQGIETPSPKFIENKTTDQMGNVIFEIKNIKNDMYASQCEVVGLKAYSTSGSNKSTFITQTELQEAKIVNFQDILTINMII